MIDKEGRGYLAADELRRFLTQVGEMLTAEEVDQLFAEADPSGSGQIRYEKLAAALLN